MRHSLPVVGRHDALDQIEIPVPCQVPWDSMAGNDRVRHCDQCRQNVYDVANLTRPEALRLLESSGGRVCLRIYRRPDGTLLTADCRERLRAARKQGLLVFVGVALVILWAQVCAQMVGLAGLKRLVRGHHDALRETRGEAAFVAPPPPRIPDPEPVMGEPSAPPPPQPTAGRIRHKGKDVPHKLMGTMMLGKPAPR